MVIVPVLSEQITVVAPRVSTDSGRRTSAPRCAMRVALIASARVSVGSRPSGTSATITPTENRNPSRAGVPSSTDTPKKSTPAATAEAPMMRTARSRSSFKGVGRRTTSPVSVAIPPSLVRAPVATTTACAEPAATNVPANTMSGASAGSEGASAGACASRATGTDSPVSIWWSTRSPDDSRIRPSAEIRSPSRRTSMSPGTRSAAGTNVRRPSRRAATVSGISSARAAVAFAARSSWLKLNTPFTTTTTTIAAPSCGIPPMTASTAAAQSINAKKWVSCETRRRRGPVTSRCGMRFGPDHAEDRDGLIGGQSLGSGADGLQHRRWVQHRRGGGIEHPARRRRGDPRVVAHPSTVSRL